MDIHYIVTLLLQYKYIIMFLLMVLEWPTVGFIAAFLAAKWYFDFGIVYILSISGDVAGDILWYRIGRRGRKLKFKKIDILEKKRNWISKNLFSRTIGIGERIRWKLYVLEHHAVIKYLERNMKNNFFISLLIVKITPPLSIPGQFSFGFLKVSFWKLLLNTIIVCFVFESVFLNLGYFSSISTNTFQNRFDTVTSIITVTSIGLIAFLIGFFIIRRFRTISQKLR